jgi:hypothetical protein
MLSHLMLNVSINLSVIMLSIVMLNVILLNVIMLNVMAPKIRNDCKNILRYFLNSIAGT